MYLLLQCLLALGTRYSIYTTTQLLQTAPYSTYVHTDNLRHTYVHHNTLVLLYIKTEAKTKIMESKPCVTILRISPQQHTRHPMTFTEVHCLVSPLKHLSFKPPGEQLTDLSFHQKTESCSIYEMSFQLLLVCCIPHCE